LTFTANSETAGTRAIGPYPAEQHTNRVTYNTENPNGGIKDQRLFLLHVLRKRMAYRARHAAADDAACTRFNFFTDWSFDDGGWLGWLKPPGLQGQARAIRDARPSKLGGQIRMEG
jgi:hypothetical protein